MYNLKSISKIWLKSMFYQKLKRRGFLWKFQKLKKFRHAFLSVGGDIKGDSVETFANKISSCIPGTSYKPPVTNNRLPSTSYKLTATGTKLLASSYRLPGSIYWLPATRYWLPAISYWLPATSDIILNLVSNLQSSTKYTIYNPVQNIYSVHTDDIWLKSTIFAQYPKMQTMKIRFLPYKNPICKAFSAG